MASVSYYVKRIKHMNFMNMFDRINIVSHKCNKPKFLIFLDMIWCGFRYGAGYMDYDVIGFYKLNHKQRDSMITRGRNDKIVKKYNNHDYWHLFNNKNEFNVMFSKFINRKWFFISDASKDYSTFKTFVAKHNTFFAKPNDGQCGKGIEKIDIFNLDTFLEKHNIKVESDGAFKNGNYDFNALKKDTGNIYNKKLEAVFKYLCDNKLYLIEEPIIQHEKMMKLNPSSVNTCRVVTINNDKGEVHFMASFIRIGNGVNVVDNFNSGGMTAKVDINTGRIIEDAINKEGKVFEKHPLSGTTIKGFELPDFEKAKEMCREAAQLSQNVRYVGWDVAFTHDGPTLVEGNQYPGHDIYQVAEKLNSTSVGVWPEFKKAIS